MVSCLSVRLYVRLFVRNVEVSWANRSEFGNVFTVSLLGVFALHGPHHRGSTPKGTRWNFGGNSGGYRGKTELEYKIYTLGLFCIVCHLQWVVIKTCFSTSHAIRYFCAQAQCVPIHRGIICDYSSAQLLIDNEHWHCIRTWNSYAFLSTLCCVLEILLS